MAFRNPFKSLFNDPSGSGSAADDPCVLLQSEAELDAAVASRDKLMVLFYASWCPFSRAFLDDVPEARVRRRSLTTPGSSSTTTTL
ncbi:MAG: hypothetical protein M0C28_00480 [Candidatus Moduliflexus flocculans]|nr:hypothetical protein [Candidatus Moduliflexus flocculans]